MIGVIARKEEMDAVREFFELFKTPWESYNAKASYDLVLSTMEELPGELHTRLLILYSGSRLASDPGEVIQSPRARRANVFCYKGDEMPIYGNCVTFSGLEGGILAERDSKRTAALHQQRENGETVLRVGYDLFEEVGFLLSRGQPVEYAGIPTLDVHIAFLREQIHAAEIDLVEIPPVPEGYRFIVCLTHDVDHPALRKHRCDHTAVGFLYRAAIGTLLRFVRRRSSLKEAMRNWMAVAKWPFIQAGVARDFWADFHLQYRRVENALPSTYFLIPFAGMPGRGVTDSAPKHRAAGYGARDIEPTIRDLMENGNEVGLHGIDAWLDSEAGLHEMGEIRSLIKNAEIGVRMHWLLFDEQSPERLERAGASYDSTIGYRETVGYRSGTLQAYVPPGAESLIELPLHIMDTALFFPGYLGLTAEDANSLITRITDDAERYGGCLTINWHDRSLSPERQWSACYCELLEGLRDRGAWFATCAEAAAWFRKRRSVRFERDPADSTTVCARIETYGNLLPALTLSAPTGCRIDAPLPHGASIAQAVQQWLS